LTSEPATIAAGNRVHSYGPAPLNRLIVDTFRSRLDADRGVVSQKLPTNTKEVTTSDGVTGFLYTILTAYKDEFVLFAYFDGAYYQVKVISPEIESRWQTPHTGHLYTSGRICFGPSYGGGMPTLEGAFAKSVLWANGLSVALITGKFPFSINND
jgi:hypothetical protein